MCGTWIADVVECYTVALSLDASPFERGAEVFGAVAEEFFDDCKSLSSGSNFDRDEG